MSSDSTIDAKVAHIVEEMYIYLLYVSPISTQLEELLPIREAFKFLVKPSEIPLESQTEVKFAPLFKQLERQCCELLTKLDRHITVKKKDDPTIPIKDYKGHTLNISHTTLEKAAAQINELSPETLELFVELINTLHNMFELLDIEKQTAEIEEHTKQQTVLAIGTNGIASAVGELRLSADKLVTLLSRLEPDEKRLAIEAISEQLATVNPKLARFVKELGSNSIENASTTHSVGSDFRRTAHSQGRATTPSLRTVKL